MSLKYIKLRLSDVRYKMPVNLLLPKKQSFNGKDLIEYLKEKQLFFEDSEKIHINKVLDNGEISYTCILFDDLDVLKISEDMRFIFEIFSKTDKELDNLAKTKCDEELSQKWTQMSTENKDLKEELSALKVSKGVIESEVKALRDEVMALNVIKQMNAKDMKQELIALKSLNETMICENKELSQSMVSLKETNERIESQLKVLTQQMMALETSGSETDCTCDGKGSQNPLNTTSGDKKAIEMFNEISKHMEMTNSLLNAMNGQKDKALTALEGIRHVVDNTDTESTASVQTLSEDMDKLKTLFQKRISFGEDSESVANTSISQSTEDLSLEPMADKFSLFVRKCYQKLSQMNEIWKSLSGLSPSVRNPVMDEMWTQFTDQLTHDKNQLFK